VFRRTIVIGEHGGGKVEVASGLAAADRVVLPAGDVALSEGMKVREAKRKN
jgi:hypothetical protein